MATTKPSSMFLCSIVKIECDSPTNSNIKNYLHKTYTIIKFIYNSSLEAQRLRSRWGCVWVQLVTALYIFDGEFFFSPSFQKSCTVTRSNLVFFFRFVFVARSFLFWSLFVYCCCCRCEGILFFGFLVVLKGKRTKSSTMATLLATLFFSSFVLFLTSPQLQMYKEEKAHKSDKKNIEQGEKSERDIYRKSLVDDFDGHTKCTHKTNLSHIFRILTYAFVSYIFFCLLLPFLLYYTAMTLITILFAYGRLNDERALSNIKAAAAAAAQTQSLLLFLI